MGDYVNQADLEAQFGLQVRTESCFRRTSSLILLILLNLGCIISTSIAIGIIIPDYDTDSSVEYIIIWYSLFIFFALVRLYFEIQALVRKDCLERGSNMLVMYFLSSFMQIYISEFDSLYQNYGKRNFVHIIFYASLVLGAFYFVFSMGYMFVLINCQSYGHIEHNVSIRRSCR